MANFWVLSDTGIQDIANALRDATLSNYLNSLTLHLYSNNHPPAHGDLTAAFTECNFHGYAAQAANAWAAAAFNAAPPNVDLTDAQHVFTATDGVVPNTVYGAYLTDADGDWIMAILTNLTVPAVLDAAGKTYKFTPRLTVSIYAAYP